MLEDLNVPTSSSASAWHLIADLDVALASLKLADLTHDHGIRERCRRNARDAYTSVKDSLDRSIPEDIELQSVRGRLDELREWLAFAR
jgi:hypothetical protein